jgi:hypothetical protein
MLGDALDIYQPPLNIITLPAQNAIIIEPDSSFENLPMCEPELFFALQNIPVIEPASPSTLQTLPNGARSAFHNTIPNPIMFAPGPYDIVFNTSIGASSSSSRWPPLFNDQRADDEISELIATANVFKPKMETPDPE